MAILLARILLNPFYPEHGAPDKASVAKRESTSMNAARFFRLSISAPFLSILAAQGS
jgi:hypothetical protein